MSTIVAFTNFLRSERNKKNVSQASFAEFLGMSIGTYKSYEMGKRTPSVVVAADICKSLGVSLDAAFNEQSIESIATPINQASASKMINMLASKAEFFEKLTEMKLDSPYWQVLADTLKIELDYQDEQKKKQLNIKQAKKKA